MLTWAQYHVRTKNPYLRKIERPILKSKNNETFTFFKSGSKNITRSKTAYFLNKILFVIWKKLSCVLVEVKRIDWFVLSEGGPSSHPNLPNLKAKPTDHDTIDLDISLSKCNQKVQNSFSTHFNLSKITGQFLKKMKIKLVSTKI